MTQPPVLLPHVTLSMKIQKIKQKLRLVIAAIAFAEIIRSSELLLELAHPTQNVRPREYGAPMFSP
jgi:hypothetical protein